MTHRPSPALREALALMRAPRGARPGPDDRLPDGIELLVRIVGGDTHALGHATTATRESDATVRDAAAFYIQQVMFADGSDSYRVLGLDPGASDEQLKSHHRRLTRWLHPDRNRDEWEAVYSERVNRAWQDLRTIERRQRYDLNRSGSRVLSPVSFGKKIVAKRPMQLDGSEPGLSLRWLPHAIFGGLGVSAIALVALYYVLRFSGPPPGSAAAPVEVDRRFASSTLANRRMEHVDAEPPVVDVPKSVPAGPALEAAAKPARHGNSMTLADPLRSETIAAVLPSALPSEALRSKSVAVKQASVPVRAPDTSRLESPKQAQSASTYSAPASDVTQRPMPTAAVPLSKEELRDVSHLAPASQREANRIVGRFSEVYAHGDLAGMRAMFTPDATSPDGGLNTILHEYDQLFGRSKHRLLDVQDVNWFASGKNFTIVASYEATVKTGLLARTRSQGKLRMEMRQVDDQWRIYRLEHNERTD
jgi:hypothetical protein